MTQPPKQETVAIENEEGFRSHAYWDPIGKVWTVDYGETGPQVGPHTIRTRQEGVQWLESVESKLTTGLKAALPWTETLSGPRFGALVDAAYNLGLEGLMGFHEALDAMQKSDWIGTVRGFENSLWYRQVAHRVDAISYMVIFNEWLEDYPDADQLALLAKALHG
jgi:lysozyme